MCAIVLATNARNTACARVTVRYVAPRCTENCFYIDPRARRGASTVPRQQEPSLKKTPPRPAHQGLGTKKRKRGASPTVREMRVKVGKVLLQVENPSNVHSVGSRTQSEERDEGKRKYTEMERVGWKHACSHCHSRHVLECYCRRAKSGLLTCHCTRA